MKGLKGEPGSFQTRRALAVTSGLWIVPLGLFFVAIFRGVGSFQEAALKHGALRVLAVATPQLILLEPVS